MLETGLTTIGDLLAIAFTSLANFLLGFFPDADPAVNGVIDSWNVGGGSLTMNVFYFIDMNAVLVCAGLAVTVVFVVLLVAFVRWVISVIHDVLDAIPIVG